ncbi:FkbM family methyltransferase [Arcobacter ellisii]|uniref:FkbM family methyltransferase n=1 Tax=Arcobacter ellisii TaxID=913109 RepID=A0A347UAL2_9BACT|nr:FkbM family methyltransferase [Arcobacter ellisii]AXX95890.1 methyltransferase, FkbM family [Arcobacter ellisii]RXI29748.1 FkbM family methyltransferase [Arcobacter ellisii]
MSELVNKLRRFKYTLSGYFSKKSFSQQGEDLIIRFIFNQLKIKNPSYMDIGAHDPYYLSNTAIFYKNGSRGINIEPNPSLIKRFNFLRRKDINLNIGISDTIGNIDFFIMSEPTMSTFSEKEARYLQENSRIKIKKITKVEILPIKIILDRYFDSKFPDFLSIDVEGIEDLILNSIDFSNTYPKVICLETMTYSENGEELKRNNLIETLLNNNYFIYADNYINTIFVHKDVWKNRFCNIS